MNYENKTGCSLEPKKCLKRGAERERIILDELFDHNYHIIDNYKNIPINELIRIIEQDRNENKED